MLGDLLARLHPRRLTGHLRVVGGVVELDRIRLPERQERLQEAGRRGGNRNWQGFRRLFMKAQRKMERRHKRQRLDLMAYEKQRQEILKDIGADPYVD